MCPHLCLVGGEDLGLEVERPVAGADRQAGGRGGTLGEVDGHRTATIADLERQEAVLGVAPVKLPATQPHAVPADVAPDAQDRRFADAPACDDCGACYRCFNCGDGMGCSRPPSGR